MSDPEQTVTPIEHKPRSKKVNVLISVYSLAFICGLGLFVYLIYRIGIQSIWASVSNVGWGFLIILGLNLTRQLMRASTMYLAVAPEYRTFKYRSAVAARFGGEAVSVFTFTSSFLGEATKAMLLRRNLPLTHGASAVIIENILHYLTVILIVLAGVVTLLFTFGTGSQDISNVLLVIVVASLVFFTALILALRFPVSPISRVIGFLGSRNLAPKFLLNKLHNIQDVEQNVFRFYHNRRKDFFILLGILLCVHVVSMAEIFMAIRFLGHDASLSTAFIIDSLTKVINIVFSFVPGTIGVYEGGNGLILNTLGYTTALGVALALIRRGATLCTTFIGLMVLLWRTAGRGAKLIAAKRNNGLDSKVPLSDQS